MTESEIFESVTGSGSTDFATLVGILNRHGKWCLIGGPAVNCYVEPVGTGLIDPSQERKSNGSRN
jgi:hypothetical protein